MKLSRVVVLAVVAQSAAGFVPTANQRLPSSKNVAFVKASAANAHRRGTGVGSLGLVPFGPATEVIVSIPSITISSASSTQAPSAVNDVEKLVMQELLLEKEVKAVEKEAKVDAKVRFSIISDCRCQ
jgi:hypothetical protein